MRCTVVRPALWICGGKHCSFHITSLPSDCEDWITCSRQFFTETEGNNIHISEFYPQSLREKTLRTLVCPQCPQITTVCVIATVNPKKSGGWGVHEPISIYIYCHFMRSAFGSLTGSRPDRKIHHTLRFMSHL